MTGQEEKNCFHYEAISYQVQRLGFSDQALGLYHPHLFPFPL
jgi:hypothetical protein